MWHLTVFFSILALVMGIISIMTMHRLYGRYGLLFQKIYLRYLVVLNLAVLLNLSLNYLLTNVLASMTSYRKVMMVAAVNTVGFYLFALLTFYYLLLIHRLIDKDGALLARNVMIPSVVAGSVAYGFSLAVYASSANVTPFLLVHKSSITLLSVISLIAGFFLFARAGESGLKSKIRAVRIFAVVYTLYYLYQLLLWVIPVPVWIFLSGFNLFLLNFIPIPLVAHLVKGHKGRNLPPGTRGKIESFYEANGLSRREREIADLIVAGKSNEEIEEELFISIFTVKKHVSNIFMKLDVKSRSQLSHSVYSAALEEHSDGGERGD